MYKLTIVKVVSNPNYDEALEHQKQEQMNHGWGAEILTPATYEDKALTVDLTDDEFKAIKKAVLEVM